MIIEVKVPSPGESISEVQLAGWLVDDGEYVEKDQDIAEIDSDKATLSISAAESGVIRILKARGENVGVGAVVATIDTDGKQAPGRHKKEAAPEKPVQKIEIEAVTAQEKPPIAAEITEDKQEEVKLHLSPLAKKLLDASNLSQADFIDYLKQVRFGKSDIEFFIKEKDKYNTALSDGPAVVSSISSGTSRETERRKMSTLRLKLAERLVSVKNETAMLTTFNEVNMGQIMKIRQQYKEPFKEKYGISIGFMSFFTKAVTEALQLFPQVNARIDGDEMVFHHYADIGIAVSTPKGLMVPVLRNAESMSVADIELNIKELATKARDGKLSLDEMKGGTFTITNGGVFGSMLSTPIINPPQSAILGMHNIVERPIAVNGQVEIHPIMYVALSYDHRIIDGRESVSFLVKVKEMLENPAKMLFGGSDPVSRLLGL
ncbi:MAG: 2-oxoglutarate dehydrogenase complex dihydrolipoyllysine-residue succinyltransferase [Bacteroidales bacterium]|jgi:2-oxoglutarate dehydrogenase E2 component (dihydrolipoamide succinyltransferase)|nr:2-oxoglutarate dehydrogenase complex dihydrolipoyllysine-residue succinyltransferase [Bacteroidales bacterium]MDX9904954.1 2-oxoglutarate dehydrogenase complex dihydrolipoyllysine-residue succinyltransferase [Bacteroidales bacterium]